MDPAFLRPARTRASGDKVRIIRVPCGGKSFIRKEYLHPETAAMAENALRFIKQQA